MFRCRPFPSAERIAGIKLVRMWNRLLLVSVLSMGLAACGTTTDTAAPKKGGLQADVFASAEFGTRLGIAVEFPEARSVTGAQLRVGDQVLRASLYPLDGTDPEPPPDPLPLAGGVRVSVEATLPPDCDVPGGAPVFVVTSKTQDGRSLEDRYPVANVREFRSTAEKMCRLGPRLRLAGSTVRTDGSFTIRLAVTNPGEAAELVSREWTRDGARWQAARAEIPAGGSVTLKIQGTGNGCSHEGPWEHGQVTLGGTALDPPVEGYADPC
jgi:hypothetical protein